MLNVQNFAFGDGLVRVVLRQQPWFVGVDVCAALELQKPENVLASLDDDEKDTLTEGVIGGSKGPRPRLLISEPGVYRLVFRSRKPAAERFKRWLAHDVLPQLRRGEPLTPPVATPHPDPERESLLHRLQVVREARSLFGRERAAVMWQQLGLPPPPPPPPTALDDAEACLAHLLGAVRSLDETTRALIETAIEDEFYHDVALRCGGILVVLDDRREGFVVANRHPALDAVFAGTRWARAGWMRALRRLPGTFAWGMVRYGTKQARGTFVPARYLDTGRRVEGAKGVAG